MNERIRELIQKMNSDVGIQWINEHKEKFAELIVKEILHNMENCDGDLDFAIWKTKKDFGVE